MKVDKRQILVDKLYLRGIWVNSSDTIIHVNWNLTIKSMDGGQ